MTATATAAGPEQKHPRGLYVLFFTEMWERFGFYLMVGILLLYCKDTRSNGGRGFDNALAADLVGSYVALVYFTPFIGGLIADRYLGYRRSIIIGGILLAIGYFMLAIPGSDGLMLASLGVIICGNGLFKPNISTLLGNLYNRPELEPKKDNAYNIFYMGVNIGAFICNFAASYMRHKFSWSAAFATAGVGMTLAVIIFSFGQGTVKAADQLKVVKEGDMPTSRILLWVLVPAVVAATIGWFIPGNLLGSDSNDAFVFACLPVIGFFFYIRAKSPPNEKRRMSTLLIMFGAALLFWNIYNQNATALTIWADSYSDRKLPAVVAKPLDAVYFTETVNTAPHEVPELDDHLRTHLGPDGRVVTHQGVNPYLTNLPREEWPPPGTDLKLLSTEIYQSINPFWIVFLTPILVSVMGMLRMRGMEPSTTTKMALGVLISGVSSLLMVAAALVTNIYTHKVSSLWLFSSYGVFTVSELLISPIGLSLVSKVAPRRITALMMGGWFLTTSLGGKISGILTGFWDKFDSKALFFGVSAGAAILCGFLLLPLARRLGAVVEEAANSSD